MQRFYIIYIKLSRRKTTGLLRSAASFTYTKIISSFTISLAQALMLPSRPVHSKAFSSFKSSVALRLFHALYEPFKTFLRLPVDVAKVSIQPDACEKIGVCNLAVLLQIVQMPLSLCAYRLFFFGG